MSKIKLSTLTPVHIGSGNFLQNNMDFVQDYDGEDSLLYVIDEKKIMDLVGIDKIDDWVHCIENKQNIKTFVRNAKPKDYSKREIVNFANVNSNDTLKECMHDGTGRPYIPGSSIKGAIRTAIMASFVGNIKDLERKIDDSAIDKRTEKKRLKASSKKVEGEMFGADPNSDYFRFIQVGDAYFRKGSEISTNLVNINITQKDSLVDKSKHQIVEAIGCDSKSKFRLKIASDFFNFTKNRYEKLGNMPLEIQNETSLFEIVNNHTKKLVQEEINYWQECKVSGAEGYIENMKIILEEIRKCNSSECVLRIGHTSGWRFITGAWAEELKNFDELVVPVSRPNNKVYEDYDFPKSRRIDTDDDLMGFVKLEIENS